MKTVSKMQLRVS